jgi:hypothetical protein
MKYSQIRSQEFWPNPMTSRHGRLSRFKFQPVIRCPLCILPKKVLTSATVPSAWLEETLLRKFLGLLTRGTGKTALRSPHMLNFWGIPQQTMAARNFPFPEVSKYLLSYFPFTVYSQIP